MNLDLPPNIPVYWLSVVVILGMVFTFATISIRMMIHLIMKPLNDNITKLEVAVRELSVVIHVAIAVIDRTESRNRSSSLEST